MAYSRWSKDSVWYTFWSSYCSESLKFKLPTKKLKNSQCFEICDYPTYFITYHDLKTKGIKKMVADVQHFYRELKITKFSDYTELRKQLIFFMDDVDEHFKWKNFFYHEWYIPVRNKISKIL